MTTTNNSSQLGHLPSEQIFENNTNETDIIQILSNEIVITSQTIVQVSTANMISSPTQLIDNGPLHDNLTRRYEGRRRRRQRESQRRNERNRQQREEQRRIEQQRIQQALRQGRREYNRWRQQQRVLQVLRPRVRSLFECTWHPNNSAELDFPEYSAEYSDELFEAYDLENMDQRERWEQEQLDELEGFAALEQLLLIQDEIEEENQINAMEKMLEEEQEQINQVQLMQLELWKQTAFIAQQLKEF